MRMTDFIAESSLISVYPHEMVVSFSPSVFITSFSYVLLAFFFSSALMGVAHSPSGGSQPQSGLPTPTVPSEMLLLQHRAPPSKRKSLAVAPLKLSEFEDFL